MARYYVKNGGDNTKTGLSDAQAWATIRQVNSVNFINGDIIQFKRGDTFIDADLTLNGITNSTTKTVTIQSYGIGNLPIIGQNTHSIYIDSVGLSIIIKDINIDGQECVLWTKLYLKSLKNITLDGIYADGSVGYNQACIPDTNCSYMGCIWIRNSTGNVEIKNCEIKYWGGHESLWASPATPSYTGRDKPGIAIVIKATGTLSIHDNTIQNIESDCIILEYVEGTTTIYDNYLWNGGENSVDIKASGNVEVYWNTMGRDSTWTGVGGSSTGETAGVQGLIQVLNISTNPSHDIAIHDNIIGPTDLVNFRIRCESGITTTNVLFYNNYCKTALRHYWTKGNTSGVKIYNNIFDGLKDGGQFMMNLDANVIVQTLIYNNTFYNNITIISPTTPGMISFTSNSNAVFRNNIIYINDPNDYILYVQSGSNPVVDHNILFNVNTENIALINWANTVYTKNEQTKWNNDGHLGSLFINPLFVNPIGGNFKLLSNSPARDAGVDVGLPFIGLAPDMGAIEYGLSDLCDGVICENKCIGLDLYSQVCNPNTGECEVDQLIESNSASCGYNPCEGVVCGSVCLGNNLWSQVCNPDTGDCELYQLLENNSASCGYNPCDDVVCGSVCLENDLWSQVCNPDTGECVLHQLLQPDSIHCTIPDKIPADETTILNYILLGGLGIMGLGMLILSKKK